MPEQNLKQQSTLADVTTEAFHKYAPALHRYLTRRMRRPASAPDLTQEIFERFLQVPSAEHVRNTQGYLYRIASHLVQEYEEREGRSVVMFDSDAAEAAAAGIQHAHEDASADRLALQQDLQRALLTLPPMHRIVLLAVKREGLSYEEVAQRTGLTVSTVTKYLYEARAKMKILLQSQQD